MRLKDKRYYNGVAERRTTRCCSALALIIAFATPAFADLTLTPARAMWTLALNSHITQPPAYDEANGYFAIDGDRLVAYDLIRGEQQWLVTAKPSSAPVAADGFVFFLQDDHITALHTTDGSEAWTTPFADTVSVAPIALSGWLIVASSDGKLSAFRAVDGTQIWQRDLRTAAHASPAISGDRVYVPGENGHVIALQIETGAPVWDRRLGGTPNDILALDDRIFVGATDHYMYCLKSADGSIDWLWRVGSEVTGRPAVDERRVYFVSLDNVLRAADRSHGVQQWIQMLKFRPIAGPLKAGATIVVYGLQSPMRTFDLKDGKAGPDLAAPGDLAAPPHVLGGANQPPALLVVTRDIAKGDTVTYFARTLDPEVSRFVPLANPVTTVPALAPPQG